MTAADLIAELSRQISYVGNAPIPFVAALSFAIVVVWKIMVFRFGTELANLKSHNDLLCQRLKLMLERLT